MVQGKGPAKAHQKGEPVIPKNTGQTICVVGASAFGEPISRVVHRPGIYAGIAGVSMDTSVTPENLACIINKEHLADKIFINQIESDETLDLARRFAQKANVPVIGGSLMHDEWTVLDE